MDNTPATDSSSTDLPLSNKKNASENSSIHHAHSESTDISTQNAVVLLSGGLDSVTCLYWAKQRYNEVTAVSFNYGQRHNSELIAAKNIAAQVKVTHRIIDIDIAQLGGSSLTDHSMTVPDGHANNSPSHIDGIDNSTIPNTYVPARNTIFLSYALAVAEVSGSNHIVIGVSSVDYSGYPDCRPEYIQAFETMANLATKSGVTGHKLHIQTPLQTLSKAETIRLGIRLGVDYSQTVSCYKADEQGYACGICDSCTLRKQGFTQANIADPTLYRDLSFKG